MDGNVTEIYGGGQDLFLGPLAGGVIQKLGKLAPGRKFEGGGGYCEIQNNKPNLKPGDRVSGTLCTGALPPLVEILGGRGRLVSISNFCQAIPALKFCSREN